MATNIPPHNLREIAAAIDFLIENYDNIDDISVEKLMEFVPGPDFPTGGMIIGKDGIVQAYGTGRGRLVMRGMAHIEEMKGGRHQIIITEIPYQVNKSTLIERIAELVRNEKIDMISDLRDESDQRGMSRHRTQEKRPAQKSAEPAGKYTARRTPSAFRCWRWWMANHAPFAKACLQIFMIPAGGHYPALAFELEKPAPEPTF
jgi:DNA gyrase/topoisomerase IV subunit A